MSCALQATKQLQKQTNPTRLKLYEYTYLRMNLTLFVSRPVRPIMTFKLLSVYDLLGFLKLSHMWNSSCFVEHVI